MISLSIPIHDGLRLVFPDTLPPIAVFKSPFLLRMCAIHAFLFLYHPFLHL